ncbi:hypothetical protein [Sphingomonas mollis]|uniref:Tetratricopeptide repeat protein n=1 Tax=Sphingomonas mollis TaxID=2795726 RepID=A0ABS0XT89_9SPHN|nr:hypothetical protein [Sphingomonas sp. BT553]MBJ6123247.1 hypothetical protein [Sphingomonas sp. BT553]
MIAARRAPLMATLGLAAVGAALILGAGGWLLAPSTGEQLSAAMGTADRSALARLSRDAKGSDAGTQALLARSLLAAGKPDEALAALAPVAAAHPRDPVLIALMSRALAKAGRQGERLKLLHDEAARTGTEKALGELRVVALAANDVVEERFALTRLAQMSRLDGDGIERLAYLEERAGAGDSARTRLTERRMTGASMSTDALQRLLRLSLKDADAPTIATLVDTLAERGAEPGRASVVDELAARRRPQVALALASDPRGDGPALWRRRAELTIRVGDTAGARALLAAATARAGVAPPQDIVAVAYALQAPDMVLTAAEHGAIPRPDAALTLDLARRFATRPALIARLDRLAGAEWRRQDPWLAMRLAVAADDRPAALRYADMVAPAQRDAAREDLLIRFGDRAGLQAQLLDRARRDPAARVALAERLLSIGARNEATGLLRTMAVSPNDAATRRLLYLWGPRPGSAALAWLRERAAGAQNNDDRLRWLMLYAQRDVPQAALRVLEQHPLAGQTPVLLSRLNLSAETADQGANERALRPLLDGRSLSPAQLRQMTATTMPTIDRNLRLALTRRRIAANASLPADRMDVAWAAWNARDLAAARAAVADQLAAHPDDATAATLMAEIESKQHGDRRARPWFERALDMGEGDSRARVALLSRLGRTDAALAMTRRLRATASLDKSLIADEARLLIAAGRPADARALFLR